MKTTRGCAASPSNIHSGPSTGWLNKNVAAGARQARGTIRSLRSGPLELVNYRGRTVHCDGAKISWAGVVIVDHPSPPEIVATVPAEHEVPVVVLLRRDWDFLFDQLRSVSAVADYIHRVSSLEPIPIGHEFVRYHELARADHEAAGTPSQWIIHSVGTVRGCHA